MTALNDIPVASDPPDRKGVGGRRGDELHSAERKKGLKEAEKMLAQNVIFPSIAPFLPSLSLSSSPLSDFGQDNAE